MSAHDIVIVPSRHDYPEGLPMTIYEALAMRTPLVVSDHPMIKAGLGNPGRPWNSRQATLGPSRTY